MQFGEFPFLRYVLFFILGILIYPYLGFMSKESYHSILLLLFLGYSLLIGLNLYFKRYNFKVLVPLLAYMLLLVLGSYFMFSKDIQNNADHISQQKVIIKGYLAVVLGADEQKPNSIANRVSLISGNDGEKSIPLQGEILIYHRSETGLQPGEILWISGTPQIITPPSNPGEFNYQRFMIRQQISHQHFINEKFLRLGKVNQQPIENFFLKVRASILQGMDQQIEDPKANQVAKALLLGQKKNMDKDLSNAYAATGAMHILAVSGLHVGIVYGFFFLFIKPYRLPVKKRIIYLSFIILLIWGYAFLTGMSPSVMRAATMFSLMALAQMKSRNPSVFNAIALSALLILLFDPFLIYAVGFQLSYVALLGILLFQPLVVNLWHPKNKLIEYAWQISSVGIAAQLTTFPVSVYYFHIFPTYFIFSNLVAIPGAFLIMSFGVPFMLLVNVPLVAGVLGWVVENLILILNKLIFFINQLPNAQLSGLQLDELAILIYAVVIALTYLLITVPKKWQLYSIMTCILMFGVYRFVLLLPSMERKELIIYGAGEGIAVDYIPINVAYYWQNGVNDSNFSYKVLPNRKEKVPEKVFGLMAFGHKDSIRIYLPERIGELSFVSNQLTASQNLDIKFIQRWEQGGWIEYHSQDSIVVGAAAIKITLN